ncbi:MAG: dienelactone hydrolase family protein [Acidobacteriota bacterium]|nr:dienelactone hydrolase family protein [Acidobacteriota bacterium]
MPTPAPKAMMRPSLQLTAGLRTIVRMGPAPFLLGLALIWGLVSGEARPQGDEEAPRTKSIRGHVAGPDGKSQPGAKVFVRNVKNETTTILITDEKGLFAIFGLEPALDYEIHAEYQQLSSRVLAISSMLQRYDNVLNFKLAERVVEEKPADVPVRMQSVEIPGKGGLHFTGDWYPPPDSEEVRFPAVLLLHGSGETRGVWNTFIQEKLAGNMVGVLNLDLHSGEEESSGGAATPSESDPDRMDALLELFEATFAWLEAQGTIDPYLIGVVGTGLGADLAFLASGKYENVRAAVVVSGNLANVRGVAERAQDFQPHSILFLATRGDESSTASIAGLEQQTGYPRLTRVFEGSSSRGIEVLAEIPEASDLVVEWLDKRLR